MSTLYINEWEVIDSRTLILGEGQEAKFALNPEDPIYVSIRFEETETESGEKQAPELQVDGEGNAAKFIFRNWKSPITQAIINPIIFGREENGREFAFQSSSSKLKQGHQLFIQFLKGPKK